MSLVALRLIPLMEQNHLTQQSLADHLHTSRLTVNELLRGRRTLTPIMACRLQRLFGRPFASEWLELQTRDQLAHISASYHKHLMQIKPLKRAQR